MIATLLETIPQAMPLLLRLVVVTTCILLLAATGAVALKSASAAARYRVWLTGVLGCLLAIPAAAMLPALVTWETKSNRVEVADLSQLELAPAEPNPPPQQPEPETASEPPPVPAFVPEEPVEEIIQPEPAPFTRELPALENPPEDRPQLDSPPAEPAPVAPEPTPAEPAVSVAEEPAEPMVIAAWYLWLSTGSHAPWAVAIWLLGTALLGLRLALAVVSAQRLVRGSVSLEHPQIAKAGTTVRLSDHVTVPMLVGILRPTILLPADAATWSTERLESALRHEQAHILRRDIWWQLVTSITASLLWFQPLMWLAAKRLRVERELACDDLVLATGTPACDYAAHLLDFASQATGQTASPLTVAMAQPTTVEKRIRSILNPNARRTPLGRLAAGVITAVTLLVAVGTMVVLPGGMGVFADGEVDVVEEEEETGREDEPTFRISGRIVDEEGRPLGGSEFTAKIEASPGLIKALQLTTAESYVTGIANGGGEFQVEFPLRTELADREEIPVRIIAQGFAKQDPRQAFEVRRVIGEAHVPYGKDQQVEVVLRPGKVFNFMVTNRKGWPIEGAYASAIVRRPVDDAHEVVTRHFADRPSGPNGKVKVLVPADANYHQASAQRGKRGLYDSFLDPRPQKAQKTITPNPPERGIMIILDDETAPAKEAENPPANKNAAAPAEDATPDSKTIAGRVVDEDENPVPGANVTLTLYYRNSEPRTERVPLDDQARFSHAVPESGLMDVVIRAESAEGPRVASVRTDPYGRGEDLSQLAIQLRPAKVAKVRVVDDQGEPVEGAFVGLSYSSSSAYEHSAITAATGESGETAILVPDDAPIESVLALKSGQGLDYQNFSGDPRRRVIPGAVDLEFPDEGIELKLTGARPFDVVLQDEDGKPVPGVSISPPLTISKGRFVEAVGLSRFAGKLEAITDEQGVASFDWFPDWQTEPVTVTMYSVMDYREFAPLQFRYDPRTQSRAADAEERGQVAITAYRLVPLSGRVVDEQGRPVEGVTVIAGGTGWAPSLAVADPPHRTTTDAQGRYEMKVSPLQAYLLTVRHDRLAAPAHANFAVWPQTPIDNLDFTLSEGVRIHGQVTNHSGRPIAPTDIYPRPRLRLGIPLVITVTQLGDPEAVKNLDLPDPEDGRTRTSVPKISWSIPLVDEGRYEFFAAPGRYRLDGPGQIPPSEFELTVNDTERTFNFTLPQPPEPTATLRGKVFAGQPPQELANVEIIGYPLELSPSISATGRPRVSGRPWNTRTTRDGTFSKDGVNLPVSLFVRSADKKWAAIVPLDEEPDDLEIELHPVIEVRGKLIDATTGEPIVGQVVSYDRQLERTRVGRKFTDVVSGGQSTATDDQGLFKIEGLIVGATYTLQIKNERGQKGEGLKTFTLEDSGPVDLGEVVVGIAPAEEAESPPANENAAAQQKATKPNTKTIAAQVVDEQGNPVANAEFTAKIDAPLQFTKLLQLTPAQSYVAGRANAEGEFQVSFPIWMDDLRNLGVPIRIVAQGGDRLLGEAHGLFIDEQPVKIVVRPGKLAKVKVVDGDGGPVIGAHVAATISTGETPPRPLTRTFPGPLTDAAGLAEILIPSDAKVLQVYARKEAVGLDYRSFLNPILRNWPIPIPDSALVEYPKQGVTLTLDGVYPLDLIVRRETHQPASGLTVEAQIEFRKLGEAPLISSRELDEFRIGTTNDQGVWEMRSIPHWQWGTIEFEFTERFSESQTERYLGYRHTIRPRLEASEVPSELKFWLPSVVELRGSVIDVDGSPVPGATVHGRPRSEGAGPWRVVTDDQGNFTKWQQNVPVWLDVFSADQQQGAIVEVDKTEREPVILVLALGTATGRLLSADNGQPLTNYEVTYETFVPEYQTTVTRHVGGVVKADKEGRFVLTGLIPRNTYSLTAQPVGQTTSDKNRSTHQISFDVHNDQPIDLGELRVKQRGN